MHLQPEDGGFVKGNSGSLLELRLAGPDSRSTGALPSCSLKRTRFSAIWLREDIADSHIAPVPDSQAVHKHPRT